jgi:hypothetical protein
MNGLGPCEPRPLTPEEWDELKAHTRATAAKLAQLVNEACPTLTGDDIDIEEYLGLVKAAVAERRRREDYVIREVEMELRPNDLIDTDSYFDKEWARLSKKFGRLMRLEDIREQQRRFGADYKSAQQSANRQKVIAARKRVIGKKGRALTLDIAKNTGLSERTVARHLKDIQNGNK